MASLKPSIVRFAAWCRWLPYAGAVGLFVWACAQFYVPGQGFTSLVMFSRKLSVQYLPELRRTNFYEQLNSDGYDAQYYAQIAMHPHLGDPELARAVDSLPYRARRILFCWTAYLAGGGDPVNALQVYAVQNIVAWLLLAWVLLRWFPPRSGQDIARWFGVMFTFGLTFSVRGALTDGPSLLLIAIAMALLESGRSWWSAVVMGVAGLGKETNILAGSTLLPDRCRDAAGWRVAVPRALIVLVPLLAWLVCLQFWLGRGGDLGARNFALPLAGYFHKWREVIQAISAHPRDQIGWSGMLAMLALTAQWLFFVLRPRWRDPWWRLGASYALLMLVLGDAVWEGYPGAASRVLLPMTLAFNVALPRRGLGWVGLLVIGNLLVWPTVDTLTPPGREPVRILATHEQRVNDRTGDEFRVTFGEDGWYGEENWRRDSWRWCRGAGPITLHNPHPRAIRASLSFELKSGDTQTVTVRSAGRVLWRGTVGASGVNVEIADVLLSPGDTVWNFDSDRPPVRASAEDPRMVSFRLYNLSVRLVTSPESPRNQLLPSP